MNNDRELLELAAKAAGYEVRNVRRHETIKSQMRMLVVDSSGDTFWWAPLAENNDAFALLVRLHLSTKEFRPVDAPDLKVPGMIEVWREDDDDPIETQWYQVGDDRLAATRRAIVRAAAEIGRGMK